MARPKPVILTETPEGFFRHQIITREGVFIVTYKDSAFNYRVQDTLADNNANSYKKTVYVNKGIALNTATKLNEKFDCDDFAVRELTP